MIDQEHPATGILLEFHDRFLEWIESYPKHYHSVIMMKILACEIAKLRAEAEFMHMRLKDFENAD